MELKERKKTIGTHPSTGEGRVLKWSLVKAAQLEHLHAMVLAIAHQNVAVRHDGDALQPLELGVTRAPGAEGAQEASVRVEDLDPVVAGVGDADVALIVHRDAPWEFKLTFLRSLSTERRQDATVNVKYLHPMVVGVGNDDAVRVRDGDVVRVLELTFFLATGAKLANK